jgi:uncharacterized protein (TIGR02186 family)
MIRILIGLIVLFLPATSLAKPIAADISNYQIRIDSSFTGTTLLLFGARNDVGDIVVVVRGPDANFIVRQKEKVAGVWVNTKQHSFENIPNFFSLTASKSTEEIDFGHLLPLLGIKEEDNIPVSDATEEMFRDALVRIQERNKHYSYIEGDVTFIGETLFRTKVRFPDNIPRGLYTAEIYLFHADALVGMQVIPIEVKKIGLDALMFDFAHEYTFLYGVLAVLIAMGSGWVASAMFRKYK